MSTLPLVPTGLYKIINVGDSLAASLINGNVVGNGYENAVWLVENLVGDNAENQVVIRNNSPNVGPDSFAGVAAPTTGEPVIGASTSTIWTLKPAPTGGIEITIDDLAWTLITSSQNNPILLESPTASGVAHIWVFEPVAQ
ncbi:hypothetical protein F5I97DRAFT_1931769 [Phlebopus sp. FC_14]|nr:hypothetical protein F5I97DRAFT_1931769 [Phlebopus sp. FC_14]